MTFEKLLGMGSKEWQEISDEDLYKILEPFFIVTRPEKVSTGTKGKPSHGEKTNKNTSFASLQKELMSLATKAGIVLPNK